MFKSSVLLLAVVLSAPSLYAALTGEITMTTALIRLLIAMPAAALMLGALRWVTATYGRPAATPARTAVKVRESAVSDPGGQARA